MSVRCLTLARLAPLVLIAFSFSAAVAAEDSDPAALVQQLNSEDFDLRDSAAKKLEALGEEARAALQAGVSNKDAQISDACRQLLAKLQATCLEIFAFSRDGKPAKGAELDVQVHNYTARMNNEGAKSITIDEKGAGKLLLSEAGFMYANFTWKKWAAPNSEYSQIQLNAKSGSNPILVMVSKGGTVTGQVTGTDEKPVPDAKIILNHHQYYDLESFDAMSKRGLQIDARLTATADKDGTFKLEGVPDGVYLVICQHDEHKTGGGQVIRVHEDKTTQAGVIKLSKRQAGKIQFTFTADGKPLKKHKLLIDLQPVLETDAERKKYKRRQDHMGIDWNRQPDESDDQGKFAKDNVPAGKYRLYIQAFSAADQMAMHQILYGNEKTNPPGLREFVSEEVVVEADKPLELSLSAVEGGTLTGTVLNADGKPIDKATVTAVREAEIKATGVKPFDANNHYSDKTLHSRFARSGADGKYSLARLIPGKYVLNVVVPGGERAIVYGVEVTAGKDTSAPEVKLAAPARAPFTGNQVKGRVTTVDGKPISNCNVSLEWRSENGSSSHGSNTGQDGSFTFAIQNRHDTPPTHVSVNMAGYKQKVIDLVTAGVDLGNIQIQLEKRKYCTVTLKVSDDAGKPLAGVKVSSTSGTPDYWNAKKPKSGTTNKAGEAVLKGIGEGKRAFNFELDGYYAPPESAVELTGDKTLSIVMKKGLTLKGKLQFPAGTVPSIALVRVDKQDAKRNVYGLNVATSVVKASPAGDYEVSGLAPGPYTVTVNAPALVAPSNLKVDLKEGTPAAELNVPLVPAMVLVANLGPGHARSQVYAAPQGTYAETAINPLKHWSYSYGASQFAGVVDSAGRVEIYGVAPGAYDIIVSENVYATTESIPQLVLGPVQAQPVNNTPDLAAMKETALKLTTAKGSIKLKVSVENEGEAPKNVSGYAPVTLVGKDTISTAYSYPGRASAKKPLVIGTPPDDLKQTAEPNVFTFTQLPAGEYKVYSNPGWHTQMGNPAATKDEPAKVLRTITLKDGESLDAGELKIKMPPIDPAEVPDEDMIFHGHYEEQDDLEDGFKP